MGMRVRRRDVRPGTQAVVQPIKRSPIADFLRQTEARAVDCAASLPWLQQITALEQQVVDLRLQLEGRTEELDAARAANRELMTRPNTAPR